MLPELYKLWGGVRYGLRAASLAAQVINGFMRPPENYAAKRRGVYADGKTLYVVGGDDRPMRILTEDQLNNWLLHVEV